MIKIQSIQIAALVVIVLSFLSGLVAGRLTMEFDDSANDSSDHKSTYVEINSVIDKITAYNIVIVHHEEESESTFGNYKRHLLLRNVAWGFRIYRKSQELGDEGQELREESIRQNRISLEFAKCKKPTDVYSSIEELETLGYSGYQMTHELKVEFDKYLDLLFEESGAN